MTEDSGIGASMPPPVKPLPPGYPRPFGTYLLLTPLAQGGMGEVFLATSASNVAGAVRVVVIKTLRADLANEPGYLQRFLDEARIAIQLQHPNIAQVFDVGCIDGTHYISMEHIAGVNLRRLLDSSGNAVPPELALAIMLEVLGGLDSAHRHKHPLTGEALHVVHRDVSPHNVMVSYEGDVKVIDFGLASSEMKVEQTGGDTVLGKIAYMSPEQARGEKVNAQTDQYAAAIVLYEMLVGARYYAERTPREIWDVAGQGFVPERLASALDAELAAILKRALDPVASARFPSCAEFAAALHHVLRARFPLVDRAALRDFVRALHDQDRVSTELSLRHAAAAVDSFASSRRSLLAADAGAPVEPPPPAQKRQQPELLVRAAASVMEPPPPTSATTPFAPAPSQHDDEGPTLDLHAAGLRPRAPRVIAAAAAALVVVAVVVAFGVRRAGADIAPVDAAVVAPAPSPSPSPAEPSPPSPPSPPPAQARSTTAGATDTAPAEDGAAAPQKPKPPHPARKRLAADWRSWPMERKVKALESSSAACAKVLIKLRTSGSPLEPGAVDACLASL